ncbi:MAG: glycosyltransferase family 4 protein [Tepidisphaeraceae bacterium]
MSTRLTTVQVGSGWFPEIAGGLNRYYFDLVHALPAVGVDCRGLVVGSAEVDRQSGGAVHAYAPAKASLLERWRAGRRATRDALTSPTLPKPAVLVTHFALYAWPLPRPPREIPTVVHFHGPYAAESAREGGGRLATAFKRYLERSVYRRADRLIVLSEAFRNVLCDGYGIAPERVAVIPGGVDVLRFTRAYELSREEARQRLGWPTDRPIVLAVRRLAGRMGLEHLVDAMNDVRRRVPDALCLIAGRGRLADALADRIRAAGLEQHVRLLGFVPDADLPLAYRAADVSVLPTESLEGFGLSAAESLATGTPVLVAPVGGLPEVVRDLAPGLILAKSADAAVLGDALAAAFQSPGRLPSAEQCHTYAAARFAWPTIAERVAEVYAQAFQQ